MAHVGNELRLVLACDLKFTALLSDFLKQAGILQCYRRLVGKGLHETDHRWRKLARLEPLEHERPEGALAAEQPNDEACTEACFDCRIAQRIAWSIENVRHLQGLTLGDCLAETCLTRRDVELAEPCDDLLFDPCGLAEFESGDCVAIVKDRPTVSAGEFDGAVDDCLEYSVQLESRTHGAADLTQGGEIAVPRLHFLKEARIFDGNYRLIRECLQERDLLVGERSRLNFVDIDGADWATIPYHRNSK